MCLINFSFHNHPQYKLIVAANRDEQYARPTAPAHFWEDYPNILAGRDLLQMGTWFGITKQGRIAALTNYRDPKQSPEGKISRGKIITNYLLSQEHPRLFLASLDQEHDRYQGFNIIVGDEEQLYYYNNLKRQIILIEPGIHGVSNHMLNTPWPKVQKGKQFLNRYLANTKIDEEHLFAMLQDDEIAPDEALPDTGVGIELERRLSPLFIRMPEYGTRSSTVLLIDQSNQVTFIERTFKQGKFASEVRFSFQIKKPDQRPLSDL